MDPWKFCYFWLLVALAGEIGALPHSFKVRPTTIGRGRYKRESYQTLQVELGLPEEGSIVLNLARNEGLILDTGVVEFIYADGTRTIEPILTKRGSDDCLYSGYIENQNSSLVAVSLCEGIQGYIQTEEEGYIIQPCTPDLSLHSEHTLTRIPGYTRTNQPTGPGYTRTNRPTGPGYTRTNRPTSAGYTTQDIHRQLEQAQELVRNRRQVGTRRPGDKKLGSNRRRIPGSGEWFLPNASLTGDEDVFEWYDVNLDDEMAETDELSDLEWMGHVVGNIWQVDTAAARRKVQRQKGHIVCNGPYCEYFRVKKDDPKWLEMALYIDHSVIKFHGLETVKKYILTLINIVSAIYGDPTLGANLKFVITRMIFYDDESINPIVEEDSKASLENVNSWNTDVWRSLERHERHDIAVWLTRKNIGGPSGYAPVSGVCDPERSCSLNRDEGLSSAFILAHELGHILGLSHDGDLGAGNTCSKESNEGSVMASMVAATFSYFHWSSCSAGEYHFKSNQWTCMRNKPNSLQNYTFISEKIEYEYSLDDQCRMEFDQGYSFCRSFQLSDPCAHLWCTHMDNPELCKTKKGPPMDGTACGKNKWCINGYCESTSKSLISKDGLKHNAMSGGWSSWSRWGDCSRTCGGGVSFRTRRCDNPRPTYGGKPCPGKSEEFRLCNIYKCIKSGDIRAEQCNSTFYFAINNSTDLDDVWIPYEHEDEKYKCRLACFNFETKEHIMTDDNVIDGTPCSYDHPSNICIQGECTEVGCDKLLGSSLQEDRCGICAGDGTKCSPQMHTIRKNMQKSFTKIFVLPKGARGVEIQETRGVNVYLALREKKNSLVSILDGSILSTGRVSVVSQGAKFDYRTVDGREFISTRGPLLGPITIGITGTSDEEGEVLVQYVIETKEDTLSSRTRYEWQTRGWSKCSEDCGGGVQKLIIRCYDSSSGKRMQRRHCGTKRSRPKVEKRPCNTFPCESSWVLGDWENCDETCGKTGLQYREVFCVPNTVNRTDQVWKHMADVRYCSEPKPAQTRECGRVPCPAVWQEKGWGPCSVSCGLGYKTLLHLCPVSGLQACGAPPVHRVLCTLGSCTQSCREDKSPVCTRGEMSRYCDISTYREKCCLSCSHTKLTDHSLHL